ncbi:MAG: MFS transporter [Anaerolineales bacterium]|nr:MFS transporter [Anaerolineales bacterium]
MITSKRLRWQQSILYFLIYIMLGIGSSIFGPSIQLFADKTHSTLGDLGVIYTFSSIGFILGSLLAGVLYDKVKAHYVVAGGIFMAAIIAALQTTIPYLWLLAAAVVIGGFGTSALDLGGNTLMVWVHKQKVGPYMNALHFFFGVGATIGPILVTLMRTPDSKGTFWPFWILAITYTPLIVIALLTPSPSADSKHEENEEEAPPKQANYPMVFLLALLLFLYVGAEIGFGGWVFSYATRMGLTDARAADRMTSIFWGSLTLGRLLSIPITSKFKPGTVLTGNLVGWLLGIFVIISVPHSSTALWIGTFILGFSMSSVFPTAISVAERLMPITGKITSLFYMGVSLGSMSLPWLMGKMFDWSSPLSAMYIVAASGVVAMFLLVIIRKNLERKPELIPTDAG